MTLVDYSDSDDSDVEATPVQKPSAKPFKGTFQKVVDRSNPGKIRVSLPQPVSQESKDNDEHQAKRIKTGGGGLSDFKSFLPPPKRTGVISNSGLGGGNVTRTGLFAGVSLKTGAAPGFSRENRSSIELPESNSADIDIEGNAANDVGSSGLPLTEASLENNQKPAEEVKLVGKPLMFKPLSVARNPAKKKKKSELSTVSTTTTKAEQPPQKPKVSLFSLPSELSDSIVPDSTGDYQPMIYGTHVDEAQDLELPAADANSSHDEHAKSSQSVMSASTAPIAGAQSLSDVASDLNLSKAERRQLFGRQKDGSVPHATKIINFNTDEEYRHNQELRAAGEQFVHNPVRSIAPGKHSLKQLVNAAASQKEALEESFAKGKSNRAEAGSRYGW